MKRFVVIMWDLSKFENVRLLKDNDGNVMLFPRRKEAREYVMKMTEEFGFTYRATSIHL